MKHFCSNVSRGKLLPLSCCTRLPSSQSAPAYCATPWSSAHQYAFHTYCLVLHRLSLNLSCLEYTGGSECLLFVPIVWLSLLQADAGEAMLMFFDLVSRDSGRQTATAGLPDRLRVQAGCRAGSSSFSMHTAASSASQLTIILFVCVRTQWVRQVLHSPNFSLMPPLPLQRPHGVGATSRHVHRSAPTGACELHLSACAQMHCTSKAEGFAEVEVAAGELLCLNQIDARVLKYQGSNIRLRFC